jgi:hypothetical protein
LYDSEHQARLSPVLERAGARVECGVVYFGVVTFGLVAILCIVAYVVTMKRRREYEEGE